MDLLVIAGPTASGKTSLGVAAAKALNGEVISGDSLQVYRHMNIGTAKATVSEMEGIPHHLIDILEPSEPFSAAAFKQRAVDAMADIQARGKLPILVGGSGFYIHALLGDTDFDEASTNLARRNALALLTPAELYTILSAHDPDYAMLNQYNKARLVRGLEFFEQTGQRLSVRIAEQKQKQSTLRAKVFVLDWPRDLLYQRINQRVDNMLAQGLVSEVEQLLTMGYSPELPSLGSIGYKEIIAYLQGYATLETATEAIKQNTRRFAKRQLTWFRNKTTAHWLTACPPGTQGESSGTGSIIHELLHHL